MSTADEIELAAWRLAFNHIGDGTPNGVAQAIGAEMDKLKRDRDNWKHVANDCLWIAAAGSVYEIGSNDVHS